MNLPTELEIDSILQDLDGPKYSTFKPLIKPSPETDDQKLLDDLIANLDDDSIIPLHSYSFRNQSSNSNFKINRPK